MAFSFCRRPNSTIVSLFIARPWPIPTAHEGSSTNMEAYAGMWACTRHGFCHSIHSPLASRCHHHPRHLCHLIQSPLASRKGNPPRWVLPLDPVPACAALPPPPPASVLGPGGCSAIAGASVLDPVPACVSRSSRSSFCVGSSPRSSPSLIVEHKFDSHSWIPMPGSL